MYLIIEVLVSAFGHQGSSSIESIPSEGVNFTFRLQLCSVSLFCQSQLACVPWSFIHSQIVEVAFAHGSVRIECAVVRVIADACRLSEVVQSLLFQGDFLASRV
jgi:hypothetical protein